VPVYRVALSELRSTEQTAGLGREDAARRGVRVVGVDAGGTKVLGVVLGPDRVVEHELRTTWRERTPEATVALLLELCRELEKAVGEVRAFGFGLPALIPRAGGGIPYSTHLPLEGVDFRLHAAQALGRPVAVDNDVNCALRGEVAMGAAVGRRNVVMLTLGTGIGGALLLDGRLYRGARGFAAELGHVPIAEHGPPCQGKCPGRGCLEALASGGALGRAARELAERDPDGTLGRALRAGRQIDGAMVTDLALAGDRQARALIAGVGEHLGVGLAAFANAFDPELILIGGGLARAGELLLGPARRVLEQRALPAIREQVQVELAGLGERAGAIGAAIMASELCARDQDQ